MTEQDVALGLQVGGFETRVSKAQEDFVVSWWADGTQVGMARFAETGSGLEFKALNVEDDYRDNGIFTQVVRFGVDGGGIFTAADTPAREFYESVGFKQDGGWLRSNKRKLKGWLKER